MEIDFEKGIPVSVNGDHLSPVELLTVLNTLGSSNGVGTVDIIENRLVGMKSRGVYETAEKKVLYMSPRGKTLNIDKLRELKEEKELVILCGHYEGIDQRVLDFWDVEEVSIGDYILTGGELPAMVLVDAVSRLIPGVLSCDESAMEESIYSGLLEFPQYTRPREYRGMETPEVLLGGDHGKVDMWRFEQALILTREVRPDLFDEYVKNHGDLGKDRNKVMEKVLKML